ncbi:MAG: hypothetical protein CM1200mP14_20150 [Gammaproteobacteria bacterium]|nr:MAG: hypothetical protein CM1200mP14_20150 [Gammaproteobacteria bacterium]
MPAAASPISRSNIAQNSMELEVLWAIGFTGVNLPGGMSWNERFADPNPEFSIPPSQDLDGPSLLELAGKPFLSTDELGFRNTSRSPITRRNDLASSEHLIALAIGGLRQQ